MHGMRLVDGRVGGWRITRRNGWSGSGMERNGTEMDGCRRMEKGVGGIVGGGGRERGGRKRGGEEGGGREGEEDGNGGDGWGGWMDVWWVSVWTYGWMDDCMHGCLSVCVRFLLVVDLLGPWRGVA